MAQRVILDKGAAETSITIEREIVDGTPVTRAMVMIRTSAGAEHEVLDQAELVATLTGPERTALLNALTKIYNAAAAKHGYA